MVEMSAGRPVPYIKGFYYHQPVVAGQDFQGPPSRRGEGSPISVLKGTPGRVRGFVEHDHTRLAVEFVVNETILEVATPPGMVTASG